MAPNLTNDKINNAALSAHNYGIGKRLEKGRWGGFQEEVGLRSFTVGGGYSLE